MAHPDTEKLLDELEATLSARGVTEYLIALRDPDAPTDVVRRTCGDHWLAGLGVALIERAKQCMREGWEDTTSDPPTD